MALKNPRLSTNVHLLSMKQDMGQTDAVPLSEYLWNQSEPTRQLILNTYFVQGIGDGTLNPTTFAGYMVQESVHCSLVQESFDVAANNATQTLELYLQNESNTIENYYKGLWDKLHIASATGVELGESIKDYSTYQQTVAKDMDPIYFIVAMMASYRLWPWLGKKLQGRNHGVYAKWFIDNFDPDDKAYEKLDEFVDAAEQDGKINKEQATKVYNKCMKGEFAFFNSPKAMF